MPRAGLSPGRVVAEAAELVDEVGFDALTLTAVAERVGVAVPSLYKHVGGLDDLRHRLAAHAVTELRDAIVAAVAGRNRAEALQALAQAYREYATAHPGRYAATLRAPDPGDLDHTAASQGVLDAVFTVLADYGLADDDAIDATRILRSALHGFVALESAGGFAMPQPVDRSYSRLVDALDSAFADWA